MRAIRASAAGLGRDFWLFFSGQTISNLGTSITGFALPLLVFQLTGSALNLAAVTAATFLPYLLFGLLIGAWVDRVDRRRLMIAVDVGQGLLIGSVALLAFLGTLPLWWIYAATFLNSTLAICFSAAEFAVIPSIVGGGDLVTANGRIQASYSAAHVIGPLLGGVLAQFVPVAALLLLDAASFAASTLTLALIAGSFNAGEARAPSNIRQDIVEGLRYVISHPVLRNISIMMALINFVSSSSGAQLVLFAERRFGASNFEVGLLFAAGSLGVTLLALLAGPLRKRFSFSAVALGALMADGLLLLAFALTPFYWMALPLWALSNGCGILFNINTGTLRQTIVPSHMLGRVITIAGVLAWSAIPLGTLAGGFVIEYTGDVVLVYAVMGLLTTLIALCFSLTALGRAERYLEQPGRILQ
jgi:MFS family permease